MEFMAFYKEISFTDWLHATKDSKSLSTFFQGINDAIGCDRFILNMIFGP